MEPEITYVCKMCGRSIKARQKPNFCYFDRSDQIENIGDEDAVKMGLFQSNIVPVTLWDVENIEFGGDFQFHPFTGERINTIQLVGNPYGKLSDFQDQIMKNVQR